MSLNSGTRLGRFEIRSKVGAGGMGEVYLAQDTSALDRTVALKILPGEIAKDKDRLQRFTHEARTVSNLNHPNILTVYEFGQTKAASFLAIEYVDGVTLRERLAARRLKLIDVLDVTIQIVAALNAAHEAGVTHRDLKPENVMVRRDHIVKVLDFGLAKPMIKPGERQVDSEAGTRVFMTEPGLVMGTVSYMSPEQSAGKDVDQRTDIWSTGVVLYEMIAGKVPFAGNDIHRQIIAIQESEALPLAQQVEGVPERLEEIVAKCLAKDRDERYQTARDLLIDLRNLRRKLDVDAEIERTVAPEFRTTSARSSGARTADAGVSAATAATVGGTRATSSAEYIVGQVKQHRIGAIIATGVLTIAVAAVAYYVRARNTEVAIDSIAVLPFVNRSSDADTDYLAEGLTESLIYRLSQLPNLKVSPRSSVARYHGRQDDPLSAARELGVTAVLSGRISKRGDDLTISAELVDVRQNKLLWGEQYDRKASDLLATQREIAREIAEKLKVKVSGEEPKGLAKQYTNDNEAYQLYLKGRYHWNKRTKEDVERGIDYFQQAIRRDPNFALAYTGISDSYNVMPSYPYLPPKEAMPRALIAARRALEIDPTLAEAHAALANALATYEWNWAEAEREFKRAIELDPQYANAHYFYGLNCLVPQGRTEEAIEEMKRALELEPLSLIINANLGRVYMYARQYDRAVEQARKAHDLEPSFIPALVWLAEAYVTKGMYDEAAALCQKGLQGAPTSQPVLGTAAYIESKAGRKSQAEMLTRKLLEGSGTQYILASRLARVQAALNKPDEAFKLLEQAYQDHDYYLPRLKVDAAFDSIRTDPRFRDLVRRLGLPQ